MGEVIRFSKGPRNVRARHRDRPVKAGKTIIILPVIRIERTLEPFKRPESRRGGKIAKKPRPSSRRQ
jgi:hypothetical protein